MEMILIGIGGFALLLLSDISGIKGKSFLKSVLAFFGAMTIIVVSIIVIVNSEVYSIGLFLKAVVGIITAGFLLLLIYSTFVEVTINNGDSQLIKTGTYSLTRHPGVIWFLLYYVFGSVFFGSIEILIAGLVWSFVNVIYVIIQDKYIFPKLFSEYEKYRKETPMLFPTIKSIKKFSKHLTGGKNERFTSDV